MDATKEEMEPLKSDQMIVEEPERKFRKAVKIYTSPTAENINVHFRGIKFLPKESLGHQYSQAILSPSSSQIKHILASPDYPLGVVSQRQYFRNTGVMVYNRYQAFCESFNMPDPSAAGTSFGRAGRGEFLPSPLNFSDELGLTDKDIKRFEDKFWLSKRGIPWSLELDEELMTFLLVKAEEKKKRQKLAAMQREIFVDDKKTFMMKHDSMGKLKSVDRVLSAEERGVLARQSQRAFPDTSRRKSAMTTAVHNKTRKRSLTKKQIQQSTGESQIPFGPYPTRSSSEQDEDEYPKQAAVMLLAARERGREPRGVTILKSMRHKVTKGGKELHISQSNAEKMKMYDFEIGSAKGLARKQPSLLSVRLSRKSSRNMKAEDSEQSSRKSSLHIPQSHKDKSSTKSSLSPSPSHKDKSSTKSSLSPSLSHKGSDGSGTSFSSKASEVIDQLQPKDSERKASFASDLSGKQSRKESYQDLRKVRTASFASDLAGKQSRKESDQELRKERTDSFASDLAGKQSRKESDQELRKERTASFASDLAGKQSRRKSDQDLRKEKTASIESDVGGKQHKKETNKHVKKENVPSLEDEINFPPKFSMEVKSVDEEIIKGSENVPSLEDEINFPPKFSMEVKSVDEEIIKGSDRSTSSSKTSMHRTSQGKLSLPADDRSQEPDRDSRKSWESIKRLSFLGEKIVTPTAVPKMFLAAKTLKNLWKKDRKIQDRNDKKAWENISATNLSKPERVSKWFTGRWDDANQEESPFIKEYINKELGRKTHEIRSLSRGSSISSPKGSKTSLAQRGTSENDSDISEVIFKASKETGHRSYDSKMTSALMDKLDERKTSYKKLSMKESDYLYKMEEKSTNLGESRQSPKRSLEKSTHLDESRQLPKLSLEMSTHLDENRKMTKKSLEKSTRLDEDRQLPKPSLEMSTRLDEDRQWPQKSLEKSTRLDKDRQLPKKSLESSTRLDEDRQLPKKSLGRLEKAVEQLNRYKQIATKQLGKFEKEEKRLKRKVSDVGKKFSLAEPRSVSFDADDDEEMEEDRNYKLSIIRSQAEIVVKTEKMNAKIYELTRRKARASLELRLSDDSIDGSVKDHIQMMKKLSKRGSSLKHLETLGRVDQTSTSRRRTKDSFDSATVGKDEIPPSTFRIDRTLLPKQGDLESFPSSLKRGKSLSPPGYLDEVHVTSPGGGASSQEKGDTRGESRPDSRKRGESFASSGKFYEKEDVPSPTRKVMTAEEKEVADEKSISISRKLSQSFGPFEKLGGEDAMTSLLRKGVTAMEKEDLGEESFSTSRERSKSFGPFEKLGGEDAMTSLTRKGVTAMEKEDLGEESVSTSRERSKSFGPFEKLGGEDAMTSLTREGVTAMEKEDLGEESFSTSRKRSKSFGPPEKLREEDAMTSVPRKGVTAMEKEDLGEESFSTSRKRSKSFGPHEKLREEDDMPSLTRRRKITKGNEGAKEDTLSSSPIKSKSTGRHEDLTGGEVTPRLPVRGKLSKGKLRKSDMEEEQPTIPRKKDKPTIVYEEVDTASSPKRGKLSMGKPGIEEESPISARKDIRKTGNRKNTSEEEIAVTSPRSGKPSKRRGVVRKTSKALLLKKSSDTGALENLADDIETPVSPKPSKSSKARRGRKFDRTPASSKRSAALSRRGSNGEEEEEDTLSSRGAGRFTEDEDEEGEESTPVSSESGGSFERLNKLSAEKDATSPPRRGKIARGREGKEEESHPASRKHGKTTESLEKLRREEVLSSFPRRGKIAKGKLGTDEGVLSAVNIKSKSFGRLEKLGQDEDVSSQPMRGKIARGKESKDEHSPPVLRKQGKQARQAEALGDEVISKKPGAEKQSIKESKRQTSDGDLGEELPRERRKRTGQGQDRGIDEGQDRGIDQVSSSQRVKSRRERTREREESPEIEVDVSGKKRLYRTKPDASLTSVDNEARRHEKQRLLESDGRQGALRGIRDEDKMAARRQMGERKRGKMRMFFDDIQEIGPKSSGFDDKDRNLTGSPDSIASSESMISEMTDETMARFSEIPHPSIDSIYQSDDDLTSFEVFSSLSSSSPGRSISRPSSDRSGPLKPFLPPIKGKNLFTARSRKAARETYLKQLKEAAPTSLPAVVVPRPRITLKKPFDGWDLDTPVKMPLNARLPTLLDKIPRLINLAAKDEKKYNGPFSDFDSYQPPTGSPRTLTKRYLEHFGIMELFQFLLYNLVTNRPDKPMDFLVEMTRSILSQMKVHYDMASVFLGEQHLPEQPSVDSTVRSSVIIRHSTAEKT